MKTKSSLLRDSSGAISAATIILLFVFFGLMAFVIDLGHLFLVKSQLQNSADACALRGARAFLPDNGTVLPPDPNNAKLQAQATVGLNKADNKALSDLPLGDIQVGIWDYTARQLKPWVDQWWTDPAYFGTYVGPGIRLPIKKTASYNLGPVSMTLANLFNLPTVSVQANATAALSGVGGFYPDSQVLPFGFLAGSIPPPGSTQQFTLTGNPTYPLQWSNLDPTGNKTTTAQLKSLFSKASTPDCPPGSTVTYLPGNGNDASVIKAMAQSPWLGLAETPKGSKTYVPTNSSAVYILAVFNGNQVVGAVPVKVVDVVTAPGNYFHLKIMEGYVTPGYSGGAFWGTFSTEPKLVQ